MKAKLPPLIRMQRIAARFGALGTHSQGEDPTDQLEIAVGGESPVIPSLEVAGLRRCAAIFDDDGERRNSSLRVSHFELHRIITSRVDLPGQCPANFNSSKCGFRQQARNPAHLRVRIGRWRTVLRTALGPGWHRAVGDSPEHDVQGAFEAGMRTVRIREDGVQPPLQAGKQTVEPDCIISTLAELKQLVVQ